MKLKRCFQIIYNGLTPLHLACKTNNIKLINILLLKKGIDINSCGLNVIIYFYKEITFI